MVAPYWLCRFRSFVAAPPLRSSGNMLGGFWREMTRDAIRPYRPNCTTCAAPAQLGAPSTVCPRWLKPPFFSAVHP